MKVLNRTKKIAAAMAAHPQCREAGLCRLPDGSPIGAGSFALNGAPGAERMEVLATAAEGYDEVACCFLRAPDHQTALMVGAVLQTARGLGSVVVPPNSDVVFFAVRRPRERIVSTLTILAMVNDVLAFEAASRPILAAMGFALRQGQASEAGMSFTGTSAKGNPSLN